MKSGTGRTAIRPPGWHRPHHEDGILFCVQVWHTPGGYRLRSRL